MEELGDGYGYAYDPDVGMLRDTVLGFLSWATPLAHVFVSPAYKRALIM